MRSQFTFSLDRLGPLSSKPVLVHIILPETDNCPYRIFRKEIMTVKNIS